MDEYCPRSHSAEMESPLRSISTVAFICLVYLTVAKLGGHEYLTVPHSNQKTICSLKQYAH